MECDDINAYNFSDGINTFRFIENGYGDAKRRLIRAAVFPERYECTSIEWDVII